MTGVFLSFFLFFFVCVCEEKKILLWGLYEAWSDAINAGVHVGWYVVVNGFKTVPEYRRLKRHDRHSQAA